MPIRHHSTQDNRRMLNPAHRYFVSVAQHGSIREAAEALNVAQSALSRQILKIEANAGVRLFERHARGVKLTEAGEVFLRYAHDSLQQGEHVRSELAALKGLHRGTVRVHAIESMVQHLLPRVLARFTERHPGIVFDVTIDASDRIVAAVREGRTDIGIVFYPKRDRHMTTLFKIEEPLVALMHRTHPLAGERQLSLADIAAYPLALAVANSGSRVLVDTSAKAANVDLAVTLESNSVQLLVRFVQHGRGITLLSRLSAWDALESGELVALRLRDRLLNSATIEGLTLAHRKLPPAAGAFQRFLYAELQTMRAAMP
jgi:DNA-binding transcriptional LysR family regulator